MVENIHINSTDWTNHIVGGQLGARMSQSDVGWLLSGDARAFAGQNFADYHERFDTYSNLYDNVGDGATILAERFTRVSFRSSNDEFVYGVDVRAEAAFELTRDIRSWLVLKSCIVPRASREATRTSSNWWLPPLRQKT